MIIQVQVQDPVYSSNITIHNLMEDRFHSLDSLPVELVEKIISFLNFSDIARCRRVSFLFYTLLSSPHLYSSITLNPVPALKPSLVLFLTKVLSGTQYLSLRSFSSPLLCYLLLHTSSQLTSLDLSFSSVSDSILKEIKISGGLEGLKVLKLKGCRRVRDGIWLSNILPRVERLDISWSSIESLPSSASESTILSSLSEDSDDSGFFDLTELNTFEGPFPSLKHLNLSSCAALPLKNISAFLSNIPPSLEYLDLSHLGLNSYSNLTTLYQALLPFTSIAQLKVVDLRGNDQLHRNTIRRLEKSWGAQITILSEALLESDEEEDVRKFVELVSGVVNRGHN